MISPLSSEIAAATSSLTPGGSSIAPSTRESREEPEDAGSSVSLRGPISSSAPLSESRSLGEAESLTMRVAMRSTSGTRPRCSRTSSRNMYSPASSSTAARRCLMRSTTCSGGPPPRREARYWIKAPAAPASAGCPSIPYPLSPETPKCLFSACSPAEGSNVQRGAELTAARTFGSLSAAVRSGTTISRGDHRSSSAGSCSSETSVPVNSPVDASTTAMPARPSLTRDAALAGRLAARQPDRERLRDPLRILLEGLEERPDLVQEDRLRWKLRLQLRVTSKHGTILRPEPRFVSPESYTDPGSQNGDQRANDESKIEQATEHQPSGPQL